MKLFYLDFWSTAMYSGPSNYGDRHRRWFDLLDQWGGMEGEWTWIKENWLGA